MRASSQRARRRAERLFSLFLWTLAGLFLLPLLYVANASLLGDWELNLHLQEIGRYTDGYFLPLRFPPYEPSLGRYGELFFRRPEVLQTFVNSCLYALAACAGMLGVAPLAAFAFAKLRFRLRETLFYAYLFVMLLPYQLMGVGQYMAMYSLKLLDNPLALILPEIFAPFSVFFLRQYMRAIPDGVLEAASLDGASTLQQYARVALPMSRPALVACGLLAAAKCWNMIEQPVLLLETLRKYPLSLYLHAMMGGRAPVFYASCVLALLPMALLFLLYGDDLMEGIAQTEEG